MGVRDNETQLRIPTEIVNSPPVSASAIRSSSPRNAKKLPIWAHGTIAQPVKSGRAQNQDPGNISPSHSGFHPDSTTRIHNGSRSLSSSFGSLSFEDLSAPRPPLPSSSSRSPAAGTGHSFNETQQHGGQGSVELTQSIQWDIRGGILVTISTVRSSSSSLPVSSSITQHTLSPPEIRPSQTHPRHHGARSKEEFPREDLRRL